MTINEIKGLTKFLNDDDVENIKKQIKDKEVVLKSGKLDEEEMVQVLNSLFAILVIEKTLESQIEDVEEIRDQLENELLEAYEVYDSYMIKYKKEEKKKKKSWLLQFLSLSDAIHDKKEKIGGANKAIKEMKNELDGIKQQKSDKNLNDVVHKCGDHFAMFCEHPEHCKDHSKDLFSLGLPPRKPRPKVLYNYDFKNKEKTNNKQAPSEELSEISTDITTNAEIENYKNIKVSVNHDDKKTMR